ncbi:MAG: tRNA 2-thiouridine(34) synthase MnmA [Deltaproteobacteria bacterium]|nr:tRNA 2-thiouridine(34) synthase MnmA [Deltaproteobacteria bacterium]
MTTTQSSVLSPQSSPRPQRVLAALSGGVDSAVAAALLVEAGYEVIAISMLLAGNAEGHDGGCCSIDDFQDARRVAEQLNIPYYVLNLKDTFRSKVIDVFTDEYLRGRTPNPCLLCNRDLKFDLLWQRARELDAHYVATGHYAQVEYDHEHQQYHLLRAVDQRKDQSYFLFTLSQAQLARTLFPVGHLTKDEVREKARTLGLRVAEKPESQDICFVPDGNYARFIEQRVTAAQRARLTSGAIVDQDGQHLGSHDGIHQFTVGQRRGLGLGGLPEPQYVTSIDADRGRITVGTKSQLMTRGLTASGVSWVEGFPTQEVTATVKIRYRHPAIPSRIVARPNGQAEVWFQESYPAVTPGQAAVFYDGERVLGGGWIEKAL